LTRFNTTHARQGCRACPRRRRRGGIEAIQKDVRESTQGGSSPSIDRARQIAGLRSAMNDQAKSFKLLPIRVHNRHSSMLTRILSRATVPTFYLQPLLQLGYNCRRFLHGCNLLQARRDPMWIFFISGSFGNVPLSQKVFWLPSRLELSVSRSRSISLRFVIVNR
jgi:hypothetical protein